MPATLKDQLQTSIAAMEADGSSLEPGGDWWQLSAAEERMFGIDRTRFARMVMTYHCYEGFKGMADSPEWDDVLVELARQERPEWCDTPPGVEEFQQFGQAFSGLTLREGFAMFYKAAFHLIRGGVMRFADE